MSGSLAATPLLPVECDPKEEGHIIAWGLWLLHVISCLRRDAASLLDLGVGNLPCPPYPPLAVVPQTRVNLAAL